VLASQNGASPPTRNHSHNHNAQTQAHKHQPPHHPCALHPSRTVDLDFGSVVECLLSAISPFQSVKENWKAVTFLNCNCISPESPGRRLIEEIEFSFFLKRTYMILAPACCPLQLEINEFLNEQAISPRPAPPPQSTIPRPALSLRPFLLLPPPLPRLSIPSLAAHRTWAFATSKTVSTAC
jgi:hypothetical protein